MKPDIRWQLILAAVCLGLVLAFLSYDEKEIVISAEEESGGTVINTDGACTALVPASGWTLVEGVIGRPQFINPLLADQNPVDEQISDLIFDGLTRYDKNGHLVPALANNWSFSEDGRLLSFTLRDDVFWHDGEPFTAEDVAFSYGLFKDESFPSSDATRELWQSVSITVTGNLSVEFGLPQSYGPFIDATTMGILPAHLLEGVNPQDISDNEFNSLPIGTGPFRIESRSDWQNTGVLRLTSNEDYWHQNFYLDTLELHFFPNSEALLEAFEAGDVQAISTLPSDDLPQYLHTPNLGIYSSGEDQYTQLVFNQMSSQGGALTNLSVRKALAYALDRPALIDQVLAGQGLPLEGPYLPTSWAYNQGLLTAYTYQPETAAALFSEAGWNLVEGTSIRQRDGEDLNLRLLTTNDDQQEELAGMISNQWGQVGVDVEVESMSILSLTAALEDRDFDVALVEVTPPGDPDLYDFWSQEAIIRGQNYGGWNNRRASEALEGARKLTSEDERLPYYQAFLKFYDTDLPALTLFQPVVSYGLSEEIEGVDVGVFSSPRERYDTLANWHLSFEEIAVACQN